MPDPQDPATFERSKLTRRIDPELLELYRRLIAARRELPRADVDEVEVFDDDGDGGPQLVVRRGGFRLFCNFADAAASRPLGASELVLATHGDAEVRPDGEVRVPARAGALVR